MPDDQSAEAAKGAFRRIQTLPVSVRLKDLRGMSASISLLLINLINFLSKVSPLVQILGNTVALSSGVPLHTPRSISHIMARRTDPLPT